MNEHDEAGRGSAMTTRETRMAVKITLKEIDEARAHYRLCEEAQALGIPTSVDDPRSPKSVNELRDVRRAHSITHLYR